MSLGQFLEKCVHTRNHIFSLVFMEHGQNLCLMFILTTLKLGHAGYKIVTDTHMFTLSQPRCL